MGFGHGSGRFHGCYFASTRILRQAIGIKAESNMVTKLPVGSLFLSDTLKGICHQKKNSNDMSHRAREKEVTSNNCMTEKHT
jgi:hypothetical protein